MSNNIMHKYFIKHLLCYSARNIYEANMLIIRGFIPAKLALLLSQYVGYLPKNRFILHINSCDNNFNIMQNTNINYSVNLHLRCGVIDEAQARRILNEARQCLQA